MTAPTDWRGTPITPGSTVIYGAGVGRSIELVEAVVTPDPRFADAPHLTKQGNVWLTVTRRSCQRAYTDRVNVGPDRLTVVAQLPPTQLPTARQDIVDRARADIAYHTERIAEIVPDGPDRPTHDKYGRERWTAADELAYHQRAITKAQKQLDEHGEDRP